MDKWLSNINVIRAVAVLLGILLWAIVRLDVQHSNAPSQPTITSTNITDVSIQVTGLDENRYTLRSMDPSTVTLNAIGTPSALRRVNTRDYQVVLDLSGAAAGEHVLPLSSRGFPNNVDVVIHPSTVTVVLDEKQRKEVPVAIQVNGSPADGFTAGEPVVQPNRVNVTVTSSLSEEVHRVVGVVNIAGARASVEQQVKLVAYNQAGNPLDVVISPAVVAVEVPITSPFKTVPLQISLEGATPQGLAVASFEQSASEVTVYGPQSYLDSLEFYDGLSIDLSALLETRSFEFEIPLKDNVERVEPQKVTARVTIVPAETTTLTGVPLVFNGRNDEYVYRFTSPDAGEVDVAVKASPERIRQLGAEDVKAVVDVSNIPPGVHELPVDYSLPSYVETVPGNTGTVSVTVEAKSDEAVTEPTEEAQEGHGSAEEAGDVGSVGRDDRPFLDESRG